MSQQQQRYQAQAARRVTVAAAKQQQQQLYMQHRQERAMPAHLVMRTDQTLSALGVKPLLQLQFGFPGCSQASAAQRATFKQYVSAVVKEAGEALSWGDSVPVFWHRTEERQPAGKTAVAYLGWNLLVKDEAKLQQLIDANTGTVPVPGQAGVRLAVTYD
jgi:choline dehydrogenase-like flavoprotein